MSSWSIDIGFHGTHPGPVDHSWPTPPTRWAPPTPWDDRTTSVVVAEVGFVLQRPCSRLKANAPKAAEAAPGNPEESALPSDCRTNWNYHGEDSGFMVVEWNINGLIYG